MPGFHVNPSQNNYFFFLQKLEIASIFFLIQQDLQMKTSIYIDYITPTQNRVVFDLHNWTSITTHTAHIGQIADLVYIV